MLGHAFSYLRVSTPARSDLPRAGPACRLDYCPDVLIMVACVRSAAGACREGTARAADHVRGLLRQAGVLYADETPARAAGHLEYVHVACTGYLTAMHTGGRSAADIDAGRILDGYDGTIVRDGYAGYAH